MKNKTKKVIQNLAPAFSLVALFKEIENGANPKSVIRKYNKNNINWKRKK